MTVLVGTLRSVLALGVLLAIGFAALAISVALFVTGPRRMLPF